MSQSFVLMHSNSVKVFTIIMIITIFIIFITVLLLYLILYQMPAIVSLHYSIKCQQLFHYQASTLAKSLILPWRKCLGLWKSTPMVHWVVASESMRLLHDITRIGINTSNDESRYSSARCSYLSTEKTRRCELTSTDILSRYTRSRHLRLTYLSLVLKMCSRQHLLRSGLCPVFVLVWV